MRLSRRSNHPRGCELVSEQEVRRVSHVSAPTEKHRRLDVLRGVWRTEITMLDASGRPGETSIATDTYRWMEGGFFLLHEVDALMGDDHVDERVLRSIREFYQVHGSWNSIGGEFDAVYAC